MDVTTQFIYGGILGAVVEEKKPADIPIQPFVSQVQEVLQAEGYVVEFRNEGDKTVLFVEDWAGEKPRKGKYPRQQGSIRVDDVIRWKVSHTSTKLVFTPHLWGNGGNGEILQKLTKLFIELAHAEEFCVDLHEEIVELGEESPFAFHYPFDAGSGAIGVAEVWLRREVVCRIGPYMAQLAKRLPEAAQAAFAAYAHEMWVDVAGRLEYSLNAVGNFPDCVMNGMGTAAYPNEGNGVLIKFLGIKAEEVPDVLEDMKQYLESHRYGSWVLVSPEGERPYLTYAS